MRPAYCALLLAAGSWFAMPVVHAADAPNNIRIVTFTTIAASQMLGNLDYLKAAHSACRQARGMGPGAFPAGLSEDIIRKHAGTRVWKYFSGKAQAVFTEQGVFTVDMDTCRVYQESTFQASVQIDCDVAWEGRGAKDDPPQVSISVAGRAACFKALDAESGRHNLAAMKELKVNGVPCRFIPDEGQTERVKHCTYGKTPFYMNNPGRPVTFETGKDMTGGVASMEVELEQFQDGDFSFAPQQFTKQAVTYWVRHPALKENK